MSKEDLEAQQKAMIYFEEQKKQHNAPYQHQFQAKANNEVKPV